MKSEYLDAAFDEMQCRYGTVDNYFSEALGIDAGQQAALRQMFLGSGGSKPAAN